MTSRDAALRLLYVDFDGVLHDSEVFSHPKHGIYCRTPGRTLFEWMHVLERLLDPHPEINIVLSTSWVRARDFAFAKSRLSYGLQVRVVGATFHARLMQKPEFDMTPRGVQIINDVTRRQPAAWLAIDDEDKGWPDAYREHLVLTQGSSGLSDPVVQDELRKKLSEMYR